MMNDLYYSGKTPEGHRRVFRHVVFFMSITCIHQFSWEQDWEEISVHFQQYCPETYPFCMSLYLTCSVWLCSGLQDINMTLWCSHSYVWGSSVEQCKGTAVFCRDGAARQDIDAAHDGGYGEGEGRGKGWAMGVSRLHALATFDPANSQSSHTNLHFKGAKIDDPTKMLSSGNIQKNKLTQMY